jgi:hypothetical protein
MALENKISIFNKLSGLIKRKFNGNVTKDVQLRFYKVTANSALLFGFGTWLLKKRQEDWRQSM